MRGAAPGHTCNASFHIFFRSLKKWRAIRPVSSRDTAVPAHVPLSPEKKDRPARTSARAGPLQLSLTYEEFVLVPLVVEGQSISFPKPVQQ